MKHFKVDLVGEFYKDGKKCAEFHQYGEGDSDTAYDAVLTCSHEFYERLEQVVSRMIEEGYKPDDVKVRVNSVKEVKQKNEKSDC